MQITFSHKCVLIHQMAAPINYARVWLVSRWSGVSLMFSGQQSSLLCLHVCSGLAALWLRWRSDGRGTLSVRALSAATSQSGQYVQLRVSLFVCHCLCLLLFRFSVSILWPASVVFWISEKKAGNPVPFPPSFPFPLKVGPLNTARGSGVQLNLVHFCVKIWHLVVAVLTSLYWESTDRIHFVYTVKAKKFFLLFCVSTALKLVSANAEIVVNKCQTKTPRSATFTMPDSTYFCIKMPVGDPSCDEVMTILWWSKDFFCRSGPWLIVR